MFHVGSLLGSDSIPSVSVKFRRNADATGWDYITAKQEANTKKENQKPVQLFGNLKLLNTTGLASFLGELPLLLTGGDTRPFLEDGDLVCNS